MSAGPLVLHASCVALNGRGLLIRGKSGAGKSSLALHLMAFGAQLVSDDRTEIRVQGDGLMACAPKAIAGLIEARGVGVLHACITAKIQICLVVDLGYEETERLPCHQKTEILGCNIPVVGRVDAPHFIPALLQYLKAGALDPDDAYPSF